MSKSDYITTREIKETLRVASKTVRDLILVGKIPAINVGKSNSRKHYRILRKDFEKFLEDAKLN